MLDPAPTSTVTDRLCGSPHRSTADQPYRRCQPATILTVTGVHENQHPSQFCYIHLLHYFSNQPLAQPQFWKGHKGEGLLLMQHIAYFRSQSSLMLSIRTNDTTKSIHMIQMTYRRASPVSLFYSVAIFTPYCVKFKLYIQMWEECESSPEWQLYFL